MMETTKPIENTDFQVQLPNHSSKYMMADFRLENVRQSDGHYKLPCHNEFVCNLFILGNKYIADN